MVSLLFLMVITICSGSIGLALFFYLIFCPFLLLLDMVAVVIVEICRSK